MEEGLGEDEGDGEIVWLELDLCDPVGVRRAVERFEGMEGRLDILGALSRALLGCVDVDTYGSE